jgi:hypothetical protein
MTSQKQYPDSLFDMEVVGNPTLTRPNMSSTSSLPECPVTDRKGRVWKNRLAARCSYETFDVQWNKCTNVHNIIGELANLATKIITLSEWFSFVSEFSHLQYE